VEWVYFFTGDPEKAEKLEVVQWKELMGFFVFINIFLLLVD